MPAGSTEFINTYRTTVTNSWHAHAHCTDDGQNSLSARIFRSLAVSYVEALHLIRQCRFLESFLNTNFTTRILSSHQEISFSQLKKEIIEVDFSLLLSEASNHASQRYVQAVAASSITSWPKVWDTALERGAFGTSCSLALLRLLSLHSHSDNKCPVPNCSHVVGDDSLCSHFLADHTTLSITAEQCVDFLEKCSEEIYSHGKTLNQIFRDIWNWLILICASISYCVNTFSCIRVMNIKSNQVTNVTFSYSTP